MHLAHSCAWHITFRGFKVTHTIIQALLYGKESNALWIDLGNSLNRKWKTRSSMMVVKGDVVIRRFHKVKKSKT